VYGYTVEIMGQVAKDLARTIYHKVRDVYVIGDCRLAVPPQNVFLFRDIFSFQRYIFRNIFSSEIYSLQRYIFRDSFSPEPVCA
jgi:hypothetical protein